MTKIALGVAGVLAVTLSAVTWLWLGARDDLAAVRADLAAAMARTENILQDRESDATIDAIPDSDLGDFVDPRWVRENATPN